jgi:hypothetical protein
VTPSSSYDEASKIPEVDEMIDYTERDFARWRKFLLDDNRENSRILSESLDNTNKVIVAKSFSDGLPLTEIR